MTCWVVYFPPDVQGFIAIFRNRGQADAFAATVPGGATVGECRLDSFQSVTVTTITLS